MNPAWAGCPGSYSSLDCVDDHSHNLCSKSGRTFSCSAALGTSTAATLLYAVTDSTDSTYSIFGTDSDGAGFCCTVPNTDVDALVLTGGAGDDRITHFYSTGGLSLCGVGGFQGLSVTDYGYAGQDHIVGSNAVGCSTLWETLYGGADDDILHGMGHVVTMYGEGNPALTEDWLIDAGDASDASDFSATMYGGDGPDHLESDNDLGSFMYGGGGPDRIEGCDGPDEIHGGSGDDTVNAGAGNDYLWGDGDRDTMTGSTGFDYLFGGADNDKLCGGAGNGDVLRGGADNDTLYDSSFSDLTYGEGGTDTCSSSTTAAASPDCDSITVVSDPCWAL